MGDPFDIKVELPPVPDPIKDPGYDWTTWGKKKGK